MLLITCACKNDNFSVHEGILKMSEATRMWTYSNVSYSLPPLPLGYITETIFSEIKMRKHISSNDILFNDSIFSVLNI